MDIISMTPAELKQMVDRRAVDHSMTEDDKKMGFWTAVSICLAFIGLFIVGGAAAIGSLVKALSN